MYVDANEPKFVEAMSRYVCLKSYTTPVKKMNRELVGRDREIRSIRAVFERPELSNVILLGEAGSGKAFDDDTLVPVADKRGYVRIGDIVEGDVIFDENGCETKVIGVYPQGEKDAYRVTFEYGESVICCDEHLWSARRGHSREYGEKYATVSLRDIIDSGEIYGDGWYIPVNRAINRDDVNFEVDPYDFGRGIEMSEMGVIRGFYEKDAALFSAFGEYMMGSAGQRKDLLQGILDMSQRCFSDDRQDRRTIATCSERLAYGIIELATSLGYRAKLVRKELEHGASGLSPKYDVVLSYQCYDERITNVAALGEKRKMTCLRVDAPSHLFQVTKRHLVTHNTALVQGTMMKDPNRIYLEVDLSRMIAELPNVDELGDKLKTLFAEAAAFSEIEAHGIVLFMDEFHQIVQISPAAVEALKPLLADSATRNIRVIASTTYVEFRKYISANQPLVERLHRINLSEPDKKTCMEILKGMAATYGVEDRIIGNSLYEQIYDVTNRYIPANAQPRKSILILDAMVGWYRAEKRKLDKRLLADVIFESEGVNIAFRVDPTTIKKELDKQVLAQDYATRAVAERLQLCVADLNDKTRPSASFLFAGSTGSGKACSDDTPVPVMSRKNGALIYVRHGDLQVGDIVFDRKGEPTLVQGVFPQHDVQMYRVSLEDGRYVDVAEEHLWSVWRKSDIGDASKFVTIDTRTLFDSDEDLYLPMCDAVQSQEVVFAVDPYDMGSMVGMGAVTDYDDYGEYMCGSPEQRWEFVRGFMDASGAFVAGTNGDVIVYENEDADLVFDIQRLLCSLGVCVSVEGEDRKCLVIDTYGFGVGAFFGDGTVTGDVGRRLPAVKVVDVEMLDRQDCQCIYVDNDEHLYQTGEFIVTHNTQLTKSLAELLFGDSSRSLIRLDMTEFSQSASVERFRIDLTTRVWERPYSIVLLDEVEKACPEVTRILLQVLDDGRLTDQNGREVSFLNSYIVMTTNAGTEIYKTIAQYEASDTGEGDFIARYDRLIRRSLVAATGNRFPPELLGRIDCIVPFQPLSRETMRTILIMRLKELRAELLSKNGIELSVNKRVVNYIVEDSLTTDSDAGGARAIMSKLQSEVTTQIAAFINKYPEVRKLHVYIEGELVSENKNKRVGDAFVVVSAVV